MPRALELQLRGLSAFFSYRCMIARRERTRVANSVRDMKRILRENGRMGYAPNASLPFDCSAVLDATMDALIVHDSTGRIVHVNQCACAMYGYDRQEFTSLTPEELSENTPPYASADATRHAQQALLNGVEEFLWRGRRKSGELFWGDVSLRRHVEGTVTFIIAIIRDITERKRIEDALRASEASLREREQRLRLINENFDSGMIYQLVASKDGGRRFTYVSDSVRRLYGASPEAVLEDPSLVFGRHHAEDAQRIRETEAVAFDTLRTFRAQFRALDPSGEIRWSSVVSTPRPQPDGTIIWEGIEFVITDLKRAEEQRANLERQLERAQRMESVGRLAGGVAHDFNNMLGVVLGHVELAKEDLAIDHPVRANLEGIEQAAQRSKELTLQLLAFARKQAIVPRVLDLNEVISSTLHILQRLIREDIRLIWEPPPDLWRLKMDASQLDQILTNLCVNARDAIDGTGSVTIHVANATLESTAIPVYLDLAPGDYVRLTVTDDGCGMDRETQSRIFEPFFTTKGAGVGTGLGLSTVYGIVRQNGGAITIDSEPGRGSTFTIYLPRYRGSEIPRREVKAPRPPTGGSETLLVVEDELSVLGIISSLLRRAGYTVLSASEPQAALALARQNAGSIRLLITDVIMPGMNGRELAQQVQQIIPGLPLLFMSGYTADIVDWQALGNGSAFLQKPFTGDELMKTLRELFDGASPVDKTCWKM
jgi:PAS domain S-box-containing protein